MLARTCESDEITIPSIFRYVRLIFLSSFSRVSITTLKSMISVARLLPSSAIVRGVQFSRVGVDVYASIETRIESERSIGSESFALYPNNLTRGPFPGRLWGKGSKVHPAMHEAGCGWFVDRLSRTHPRMVEGPRDKIQGSSSPRSRAIKPISFVFLLSKRCRFDKSH